MATIKPYGKGFRVRWYVTIRGLNGGKSKEHSKYPGTLDEAKEIKAEAERASKAVKMRTVSEFDPAKRIEFWIEEEYLSREECEAAFPFWKPERDVPATSEVDWSQLERAYLNHYERVSGRNSPNYKSQRSRLKVVLPWLRASVPDLSQLTALDAKGFLDYLVFECEYAPQTRKHFIDALHILLDRAVDLGLMVTNLSREVKVAQVKRMSHPRILAEAEIKWIKGASSEPLCSALLRGSFRAAIYLGLYCGLRNTEAAWLQWDDLRIKSRTLEIKLSTCPNTGRQHKPKSHEYRTLDMTDQLAEVLEAEQARQEEAKIDSPFVIVSGAPTIKEQTQTAVWPESLNDALGKVLKRSEQDPYGYYSLRHTYATSMLRGGADVRTVQKWMGHQKLSTTEGYLEPLRAEDRPTQRALPY